VRVFDDGAAFRYSIPEQPGIREFKLAGEKRRVPLPGRKSPGLGRELRLLHHSPGGGVRQTVFASIRPGDIIACPLLVDAGAAWIAITEADLTDWAGMYFTGTRSVANAVVSLLSPRLDEPDIVVVSKAPRNSPWRVMLVGRKAGEPDRVRHHPESERALCAYRHLMDQTRCVRVGPVVVRQPMPRTRRAARWTWGPHR